MTFSRIFLILSIINFALAAPVAVRGVHEAHEVHANVVDVADDRAATSQKRWDDWLAHTGDETSAPMTPLFLDLDHSGLHSPRASTGSNSAPSSPSPSTGSHPYTDDSSSPSSGASSDFSRPNQLPANNPHPSSSEFSWPDQLHPDTSLPPSPGFSWSDQLQANNPHPSSSEFSWPDQLHPDTSLSPSPGFSWSDQLQAKNSLPPSPDYPPSSSKSPRPTEPETKDLLSQPGPSRNPSLPPSPAVPETMDPLSQLGPGPSHPAESESMDFLDLLLKGRIKRRTYGPDAVNSAQESQAPIDTKSYVFASSPSPANPQTTPGPWKFFDCSRDLRN
jgi:hypothetical protein